MRDFDIRKSLHGLYLSHFKLDGSSVVVDELKVCGGKNIADIAVVNGALHAFEIKGAYDTLARLPLQAESYNKVFDYVTIVVNECHLEKVLKIVPDWWGVWVLSEHDGVVVRQEVKVHKKNECPDPFSIAQLLWKEEALDLLQKKGLAKGLKTKRKWVLWEKLAECIPIEELSSQVRHYLKERPDWKLSHFTTECSQSL